MKLSSVSIHNFRGLKNFAISLSDKTILVGGNNTCKTTLLDALNLTLYPGFYYGAGLLSEYDFYIKKFESPEDQIRVELRFSELTGDELMYFGDHVEPIDQHGDVIDAAPGTNIFDDAPKILRIHFSSQFKDDEIQCGVFYSRHSDETPVSKRDRKEIGFQYLSLNRILERTFSLSGNSTMQRIMRQKEVNLRQQQIQVLAQFPEISNTLLNNQDFKGLLDNLESNFRDYVYLAEALENNPRVKYEVTDMTFSEISKSVQLFVQMANSMEALPLGRQGNGTQNALSLALLMYLGNLQGNAIIAIDEPELSLHPHAQRYLMEKLKASNQQILIATHSPAIAESFDLTDLRLIQYQNGILEAFSLDPDAIVKGSSNTFIYLKRRIVDAYFSKAILLVEGDTEEGGFLAFNQSLYKMGRGLDLNKQELTLFNLEGYSAIDIILQAVQQLPIMKILLVDNDKEEPFYESLLPKVSILIRTPKTPAGNDFEGMIAWQSPIEILNKAILQQMTSSENSRQLPGNFKNKVYQLKRNGQGNFAYLDQLLNIERNPLYFSKALPILVEWENELPDEKSFVRFLYAETFRGFKGARSAYEWAKLYDQDNLPYGIIEIFEKIHELISGYLAHGTQYVISK